MTIIFIWLIYNILVLSRVDWEAAGLPKRDKCQLGPVIVLLVLLQDYAQYNPSVGVTPEQNILNQRRDHHGQIDLAII